MTKKKNNRTNNGRQNTTEKKLNIEQHRCHVNRKCTRVFFVHYIICMNLVSTTVCYNISGKKRVISVNVCEIKV